MGNIGGAFAQSFAQTLIQGKQIMEAVADRKEELSLRKKLVSAQLQEHETKTALATRKLAAATRLKDRMMGTWGEEEGAGLMPAAPLSTDERLSFAADLDPDAAAKELLAGGRRFSVEDATKMGRAFMEGQGGGEGAPPAPSPAPPAEGAAPVASEPPAAPSPGLGPQRKLDRTFGMSIDPTDGKMKLDFKVADRAGSVKIDHTTVVAPDGRAMVFREVSDAETGKLIGVSPSGPAVPPAETQKWEMVAGSLGLKPGTPLHKAAVYDFQRIASTMQPGRAQEIAFDDAVEFYRTQATARPAGAPAPAAPATSPRARARAEEVEQAGKVAGATATAKDEATRNAPIGDDAVRFVNRRTLQHPQASDKRRDVEGNPEFVQLSTAALSRLPQYQTTKGALDKLEKLVLARPDLFPPKGRSEAEDIGRVAIATAKFRAMAKTDPEVGEIETLKVTLPNTIRLFGDTGNIAVAERAIAEAGLGLSPSTREQALNRIQSIRSMVNDAVSPLGLPPIQRPPGPKPAAKPEKGEPILDWDPKNNRLVPARP